MTSRSRAPGDHLIFQKSSRTYSEGFLKVVKSLRFPILLAWLVAPRRRECKSTMKYNTFRHFTKWHWGFRDRARRIPRGAFLLCFPMVPVRFSLEVSVSETQENKAKSHPPNPTSPLPDSPKLFNGMSKSIAFHSTFTPPRWVAID